MALEDVGDEGGRSMQPDQARGRQQRSIETQAALLLAAARMFSRLPYAEARLKDISDEAGISQGSLYFHFGNKEDIAVAVLDSQQERMTAVLASVLQAQETGLEKLLKVMDGLARLISSDPIVQGGIKLSMQPITGLESAAHEPYFEWVRIARSLIRQGVEDGSLDADLDVDESAQFVNEVFVGVQVLAELADSWETFPERMKAAQKYLVPVLSGSRTQS